jgi:oxygen-independent coproporphyrinogen-3 oxidase
MVADCPVSLYFHIPFCTRKCAYCHFYVIPDKDSFKSQLMEGFALEWARNLPFLQNKKIVSIYFGGGTPSLMGPVFIAEILQWMKLPPGNEIEITLEANPENIDLPLMQAYAQAGINRVSIGVQTLEESLLKQLGRLHSPQKALDAIYLTAKAGIKNISIDLMYDLPGQTLHSWQKTLESAVQLPISHLSLYNLTIEPHTVFFKYRDLIQKQLPDEETSLQMYEAAISTLTAKGFQQYEISAFAKEGCDSRHNTGYWTARPFLGFGPSAFSYWERKRFRNVSNLNRYCKALKEGLSPIDFEEELLPDAQIRELLAIQLRLIQGVDLNHFQSRHGMLDGETQAVIKKLKGNGLLQQEGELLQLTKRGILFYDTVAIELI